MFLHLFSKKKKEKEITKLSVELKLFPKFPDVNECKFYNGYRRKEK